VSGADTFPFPYSAWVNWVAQDADGGWWGYRVEPLRNDTGWYENEVGESVRLGYAEPANWEDSLCPVQSLETCF
jgi:hypothetical protein